VAGLPGYPTNQDLLRQAQAAAGAAVPTRQSIMHQYGQSIGDVSGFTRALMGLLNQGPAVGAGYTPAIAAQQGVTNAAAQRIAAVTGQTPTAAGSAAAVGGLGDSATSHLIANQASARAYGAQLPHVAAARGALAQTGLINARNQALTQRQQDYRSALTQALDQARQNALSLSVATGNFQNQRAQLAEQQRQFNANQAYRYTALQENAKQFQQSQALQFQEFQSRLRASMTGKGGGGGGLAGFTPNEISSLRNRAYGYANDTAVVHGVPIGTAIRNLQAQGIPHAIAVYEASQAYSSMTKPGKGEFQTVKSVRQSDGSYKNVTMFNKLGYQQALRAYQASLRSFIHWVNQRQWRSQGLSPGNQRTREGRPS